MPNIPWPAATSSTFHGGAFGASSTFATKRAANVAGAAIARANSTHIGFSAATTPSPGATVPPLRTAAPTFANDSHIIDEVRNVAALPMYAGDERSRNVAVVGVSA